jgi:alpha-1,3-glucosyltransferase
MQVSAPMCALLVLISMTPCLMVLWRQPKLALLQRASAYAALCGFLFGYHVHEKAAISAVVLLALDAGTSFANKWCATIVCAP